MQVRKLEFLLADALDQGCDSVITIGPFLSNHCRATVMAAREAGLEPHVVVMALKQVSYYIIIFMSAVFLVLHNCLADNMHCSLYDNI